MGDGQVRRLFVGVIAASLLAVCGGGAPAASPGTSPTVAASAPLKSFSIAVPFEDPVFAHIFLAQANHYFENEGLDVKVVVGDPVTLVVSGQTDLGNLGTSGALLPAAQGKETTIVYNIAGGGVGGYMVGLTSINSPKDLDGKRVGTTGDSGGSYGMAQLYMAKAGIKYQTVSFQDATTMAASLASGGIQAAVGVLTPFTKLITDGKAHLVIDPRRASDRDAYIGGYFAESSIFGLKDRVEANKASVVSFLKALDQSDKDLHSRSSQEVAQMIRKSPSFSSATEEFLTSSYDTLKAYWTPTRGRITQDMWTHSLDVFDFWNLRGFSKADPLFSFEKRVNMTLLDSALR